MIQNVYKTRESLGTPITRSEKLTGQRRKRRKKDTIRSTMASLSQIYDDFKPTTEWASEEGFDTLLVFLPGFKREEIKVQITSSQNLRIIGEHKVRENHWSRFRKEFPISSNHDSHKISARFDNGILYIKHPKTIIPAKPQAVEEKESKRKLTSETQPPPEPKPELQRPERGKEKKDFKESPHPLEHRSKSGQQQPPKTDQTEETRDSPKPLESRAEPQPRKADNKKETNQIPAKTDQEKQPIEKTSTITDDAPKKLPEKEQKPVRAGGEITQSSAPAEAVQRKKKTEEEKVTDHNEELSEPVQGSDGKMKEKSVSHRGSMARRVDSHQKKMMDILVKVKKFGNLINLIVAGLLVLLLALYIKKAVMSRGKTYLRIFEGQED
ncbi:hypothetical protein SAY87_025526 [Trapa incisa]|uniref:SHSP domain-containing protein n=1 Tax=Trapa incisa TaxID=236973 RepID=A0AAN7JGS8_9MYRT|nr:hypothetical protein SAY87_025526 [Trapa incisa]